MNQAWAFNENFGESTVSETSDSAAERQWTQQLSANLWDEMKQASGSLRDLMPPAPNLVRHAALHSEQNFRQHTTETTPPPIGERASPGASPAPNVVPDSASQSLPAVQDVLKPITESIRSQVGQQPFRNLALSPDFLRDALSPALPSIQDILRPVTQTVRPLIGEQTFRRIVDGIKEVGSGTAAPEKKAEWTVLLNLTTDFDGDEEGKFYRLEDLKEFAKMTKGKSLTVVVQAAFLEEEGEKGQPDKFNLERYVVKDGTITKVSSADSKGFGQDLEDLIAYAGKNQPGNKMALILDSHGVGNEGLFGDTGTVNLDEFVSRVKNGLKGTGREKLDLTHFDSCLMAQFGVLGKVRDVTNNVVASPETEPFDGISLIPLMEHLLKKPETDGAGLAREIVRQARVQIPERASDRPIPIPTASALNLRHYEDFKSSLDGFGDKLVQALKDPESKAAIEQCIDRSRKYGSKGGIHTLLFGFKSEQYRVDLKDFSELVVRAIDDGSLKDEDRSIKKMAQEVLDKRSRLVDAFFGHGSYEGTGGLSVFLPGRNLRNIDHEARVQSEAGRLATMTDARRFADANKNEASRAAFLKEIEKELAAVRPHFFIWGMPLAGVAGVDKELDSVASAAAEFKNATTNQQRQDAFGNLHKATLQLEKTDHFQALFKTNLEARRKNAATMYRAQLVTDDKSGWKRFQLALKDGPK